MAEKILGNGLASDSNFFFFSNLFLDRVKNNTNGIEALLIDCPNCGHCVELKPEKAEDSEELKQARNKIRASFNNWMK